MAVSDDLTALAAVTSAIHDDVTAVLAKLAAAPNITPDQVTTLEAQIAALQSVDAQLKAAANPPAPTPTP